MARTKSLPLDSRLLPGFAPKDDNGRGIFSRLADGSIELCELLANNRKELMEDQIARQERKELDRIIAIIFKKDSNVNVGELVYNCNRTSFRAFARFCALERAQSTIKPVINPETRETTYQSPYSKPPMQLAATAPLTADAPVLAPPTMPTPVSESSPTRRSARNRGKGVDYSQFFC